MNIETMEVFVEMQKRENGLKLLRHENREYFKRAF
jgi:hypothetical protein